MVIAPAYATRYCDRLDKNVQILGIFWTHLVFTNRVVLCIYLWGEVQKCRADRPDRQDRPPFEEAEEAMNCRKELTVVSRKFREKREKTVVKSYHMSVLTVAEEKHSPPLVSPMQTAYAKITALVFARPHNKK